MKARTEEMLATPGARDREVKRGYGGIRDIEFAVQLLQLVHGRARPLDPRSRDARRARATRGRRLRHDARRPPLDDAYVWLRTVEHRLQLVDEHQTHTLPADADARTHLARVLGFRDRAGAVGARTVRHRAPAAPGRSSARSTRSCSSRRCSTRSPASARCRWRPRRGTAHRVRVPRRRADPRRARASSPPGSPAARASCSNCCPRCSAGSRKRPIPTSACSRCAA